MRQRRNNVVSMDVQITLSRKAYAGGTEQTATPSEVSTTYTLNSEFDKTTATLCNQQRTTSAAPASISRVSLPEEVFIFICQEVARTNYEEV